MKITAIFKFLKPVSDFIERKMAVTFIFLNKHYTPLAVVVLIVLETTFFFVTCYLFRFNHWNYWLWKNRAIMKSIYFGIILLVIKLIIGVM